MTQRVNDTVPVTQQYINDFNTAINDDLNVPSALGILWTMIKTEQPNSAVYEAALYMDKIFGLDLDKVKDERIEAPAAPAPPEIIELCERRLKAKADKNFAESDRLRKQIEDKGYTVIDKPGNTYEIKPKQ